MPKKTNLRNVGESIAAREEFQGSNLKGSKNRTGTFGSLPKQHQDTFVEHNPDYVVHSYQTPIAWHSETHGWHVPDTKYSSTTSRQQNVVRRALNGHFTAGHQGARQ